MGFPPLVIDPPNLSMLENAAGNPYHCGANCLRPSAMVIGSVNVASSFQRESLRREGWPAKRSRIDPVITRWGSVRETPGAVGKDVLVIL